MRAGRRPRPNDVVATAAGELAGTTHQRDLRRAVQPRTPRARSCSGVPAAEVGRRPDPGQLRRPGAPAAGRPCAATRRWPLRWAPGAARVRRPAGDVGRRRTPTPWPRPRTATPRKVAAGRLRSGARPGHELPGRGALRRPRGLADLVGQLLRRRPDPRAAAARPTAPTSRTPRVAQHLGGDQWGMMNETGNYPGQPWMWLYTFWYQVKPFSTSENADAQVWAPDDGAHPGADVPAAHPRAARHPAVGPRPPADLAAATTATTRARRARDPGPRQAIEATSDSSPAGCQDPRCGVLAMARQAKAATTHRPPAVSHALR